jgi:hypothetical protein
MKTITIVFSRAKAWYKIGSKIITESEKRDYSHVALLISTDHGKFVLQASGNYINMITEDAFLRDNTICNTVSIELHNIQYKNITHYAMSKLGVYYSKTQLFLLAIKKLLKLELSYSNEEKAMICSEYVIRSLEHGMKINVKIKRDYITPSDVETILKENGLWT